MKKLLAACCVAGVLFTSFARADDSQTLRTVIGEVPAGVRMIRAENQRGDVTVTAVGSSFGWEWSARGSGERSKRVEDYAQECRVDVREVDGALELVVIRPDSERNASRINPALHRLVSWATFGIVSAREGQVYSDLKLRVPANAMVEVKNRFGAVRVSGLRAAAMVDCRNGHVELSDIDAAVSARTSFGSLRAEKVGPAQLTNQNGHMEVRNVAGALQAATSFGRLKVEGVKGDATLKNQNGAIEAAHITGDVTATTSFASVRIEEAGGKVQVKGQNARVEVLTVSGAVMASTSFGSLRIDGSGGGAIAKNQNGRIDALRVTGDVIAETSFGDLHVEEISGRADLDCRNGKIDAVRVTGNLRAANSFASLHVREIGGAVDLQGQNADVTAGGVTGDVRARTSFGRLQLEGTGQRFEARNQNGTVEIVASSRDVRRIDASASFGAIDVRLPGDSNPLIRATTSSGKVKSDYPVLLAGTFSEARFAEDVSPLKVSLRGQNGDIRIQSITAR